MIPQVNPSRIIKAAFPLLLLNTPLKGEEWTFHSNAPDYETHVNGDWQDFEGLDIEIKLKETPKDDTPSLALQAFLKVRDTWQFQTVSPLKLTGARQVLHLRLDRKSPDWETANIKRPFAPDALRFVNSWGLRVLGNGDFEGNLEIGSIHLVRTGSVSYDITDVAKPEHGSRYEPTPISFRLHTPLKNPYDRKRVRATLKWEAGNKSGSAPAYFRQDYVAVTPPTQSNEQILPLELPRWQANWVPQVAGPHHLRLEVTVDGRTQTEQIGTLMVNEESTPQPMSAGSVTTAKGSWPANNEESQQSAWELEQQIASHPVDQPRPMALLQEGDVSEPGKWQGTRERLINRAHYLWARYGHYQQVSGLSVDLDERQVAELRAALPNIPIQ